MWKKTDKFYFLMIILGYIIKNTIVGVRVDGINIGSKNSNEEKKVDLLFCKTSANL